MTSIEKLNILHIGIGNVGRALINIITANRDRIRKECWVDLKYCGFFTSKTGYFYSLGLPDGNLHEFKNEAFIASASEAVSRVPLPFVIIDTTASEDTSDLLLKGLRRGGGVVTSNKKHLSGSQELFDQFNAWGGRLSVDTTVGAGLPIIQTLKNLLLTGDQILEIQGSISGTLGFICSAMEKGMPYSEAVRIAQQKKYTEPNIQDDLSGLDVARKALTLARIMGWRLELDDIKRAPFSHGGSDFTQNDDAFAKRVEAASAQQKSLRYVATLKDHTVSVALQEVSKDSPLSHSQGPDNLVVYKTKRYNEYPLVIQGPGTGVEVAAAGILTNVLSVFQKI